MRAIPTAPTRQQLRYAIQKTGSHPSLFGAPGAPVPPRRERRAYARWMRTVQSASKRTGQG